MKAKVRVWKEIDIKTVKIEFKPRNIEEIPSGLPLIKDGVFMAEIDIDTGQIKGWPIGAEFDFHEKVCDEGTYTLYDSSGSICKVIDNWYVPNGLIPGDYGDYIHLKINSSGVVTNWPKTPKVDEFYMDEEG